MGAPPVGRDGPSGSWRSDVCTIMRLGWPQSINLIITFLPGLGMLFFLGADPDHTAAAGMGFMFTNVAGFSLIVGSGAGAQPLISQAFGAGGLRRCGDLLQRQLAMHAALCACIALVWLSTEQILLALGQPPGIARLAGQFVQWRVAALPALAVREDLSNYLVAQRVTLFPMLVSVAAGILNMAAFAVLIPRMGFVGAPLAYTVANITQATVLWLFTRCTLPDRSSWPQWSMQSALSGWGEMLALALPGGVLMLCEWWGWETNLFFAGLLCGPPGADGGEHGCVQLDAFPVLANTMVLGFMPAFGLNVTAGALIGNALGANDPTAARRLSRCTLCLAGAISGSVALSLVVVRESWGELFSEDAEIAALTSRAMPTIAAYIFLDSLGPGALVCILRGMSVVRLPAVINFVAFYVIGIPFGLLLAFGLPGESWGIIGLWSGLVLGMFVMVSSLLLYLCLGVDWAEVAEAALAQAGGKVTEGAGLEALGLEECAGSCDPAAAVDLPHKLGPAPAPTPPKAHLRRQRGAVGRRSPYRLVVEPGGGAAGGRRGPPSGAEPLPGAVAA